MTGVFPFGAPVLPRPPSRTGPAAALVLGAYPSALHVRWSPPANDHCPQVRALAVDNEPTPFWDGTGETELIEAWKTARFDPEFGRVEAAGVANGSSGRWVLEQVLAPLGIDPGDVCLTDCLDTYRLSRGQEARLKDAYGPFLRRHPGVPSASIAAHPSEAAIVSEAGRDHVDRLRAELNHAAPKVVITLGNAAARVFHIVTAQAGIGQPLRREGYGAAQEVEYNGQALRWLAVTHPGAGAPWPSVHQAWRGALQ